MDRPRHIIWRIRLTETGEVLSAISRARARAAGSRSSGACTERTSPPARASGRREDAARVAPLQRLGDADKARQEEGRAGFRRDAAAGEDEAEARVLGGQTDVHGQLHGHPDADRGAVHGGDDRLEALIDAQGQKAAAVAVHFVDLFAGAFARARIIVEGLGAAGKVRAGAEAAAGAGDDHRLDRIVRIRPIQRRDHLGHHLAGERVQLVRPIEGDGRDPVLDV